MENFKEIIILVGFAIALTLLACSCANIQPVYDSSGRVVEVKSTKFLADLEYSRTVKYRKNGEISEETISYATQTNADRIIGEANKAVGTAVGVARDLMP